MVVNLEVTLELSEVYGGDGKIRYEDKERVSLQRTRTKTQVRESTGVVISDELQTKIKEKKIEPIATFDFDKEGNPILRLGGAHGKFWGALKSSAKQLWQLGDSDFKRAYKAVPDMILVSPPFVSLESDSQMHVDGIPQVLKGGGGMIVQQFDVIPMATCTVRLTFPDAIKSKVQKLLDQIQVGTHFNKRRTTIKVLDICEV